MNNNQHKTCIYKIIQVSQQGIMKRKSIYVTKPYSLEQSQMLLLLSVFSLSIYTEVVCKLIVNTKYLQYANEIM